MSSPVFIEKQVEFSIPAAGKKCKTWYKVFGDLANRTHRPLIALHGGPGISHEYLLPLVDLTNMHSIPLILYDQVGTGFSTHIPEKKGDTTFWTIQLFLDELDNLLTHLGVADDYDLLGHSWGGMLAASHAVQQPAGLKHLVLASSLPDMNIWLKAQWEHREQLPKEVQDILAKHEAAGTRDSAEYQGATMPYISSAVCRLNPMPEDLAKSFQWMSKDFTVASTMCVFQLQVCISQLNFVRYGPGQVCYSILTLLTKLTDL